MKILIVDDNPRRYKKLKSHLLSLNIDENDIDIVTCTLHARDKMEDILYDLVILDLLIPLRPEDDPDARESISLLKEITAGDLLRKPKNVVGLTADRDAATNALPIFAEFLWTTIQYSDQNDSWLEQIKNCISYYSNPGQEDIKKSYGIDLCIICALDDPELKQIFNLPFNWNSTSEPVDDTTFVRRGFFKVNERLLSIVATSSTRMGMVSTTLLASKMINIFRPRMLVMTGICAGVKGKVNLGDVVVADPCWDWQSGKRILATEGSVFKPAPHHLPLDEGIRNKFREIKKDFQSISDIQRSWPIKIPTTLDIVVAPMASGSVVLADEIAAGIIGEQHRELSAIEMEAYGIYAAVASASEPKPKVIAIKSVCDFADAEKNDGFQDYASYTSANVLRLYIERFGVG